MPRDPQDSFKLLQKQINRDPRDFFKLLQKHTGSSRNSFKLLQKQDKRSPRFFQITSVKRGLWDFFKPLQKSAEILSNYFKYQTQEVPEILQSTSKTVHNGAPRFFQTISNIRSDTRDSWDSFKLLQKADTGFARLFQTTYFRIKPKEGLDILFQLFQIPDRMDPRNAFKLF